MVSRSQESIVTRHSARAIQEDSCRNLKKDELTVRKLDQLRRLHRGWSLILPSTMLSMNRWIIEHRRRQGSISCQLAECFLVRLQQRIGHREHLPGNAANHPSTANVGPTLLIVAAFDWH